MQVSEQAFDTVGCVSLFVFAWKGCLHRSSLGVLCMQVEICFVSNLSFDLLQRPKEAKTEGTITWKVPLVKRGLARIGRKETEKKESEISKQGPG